MYHDDDDFGGEDHYIPTSPPAFYEDDEYKEHDGSDYNNNDLNDASYELDDDAAEERANNSADNEPSHSDQNSSSEEEAENEDLDAFLIGVESKLRAPFSSLDLSKIIASAQSPKRYMKSLTKVFGRMQTPIKLRTLIALMGLEPDVVPFTQQSEQKSLRANQKFHTEVWNLLEKAMEKEEEADEWVRIMAGLVCGKMFAPAEEHLEDATLCRGKETKSLLRRTTEGIIKQIREAAIEAHNFKSEAEMALLSANHPMEEEDEEGELTEEKQALLNSYLLEGDGAPLFGVPLYYSLLCNNDSTHKSSKMLSQLMPELNRNHFTVNSSAEVLSVDAKLEEKRAEEEFKELEQKKRIQALTEEKKNKVSGGTGVGPSRATADVAAGIRGVLPGRSVTAGRGGSNPTMPGRTGVGTGGGLLGRTTVAGMTGDVKRRGLGTFSADSGVLHSKAAAGNHRGTSALPADGKGLGNVGTAGSTVAARGRMAGLGRGAAASAIGGRSLATPVLRKTPVHNRQPGAARALLASRRGGTLSSAAAAAVPTLTGGGRTLKVGATNKMRMIDVDEVKDLNQEQMEREKKMTVEESREAALLARKKRIMEASGLRTKKASVSDGGVHESMTTSAAKRHRTENESDRAGTQQQSTIVLRNSPPAPATAIVASTEFALPKMVNTSRSHAEKVEHIALAPLDATPTGLDATAAAALAAYQQQSNVPKQQPDVATDPQQQQISSVLEAYTNGSQPDSVPRSAPSVDQHLVQPTAVIASNTAVHHHHRHPPSSDSQFNGSGSVVVDNSIVQQLFEKSNKMTPEDRVRVQHFFTDRINPTPDIMIYKMKLHEERGMDPDTKQSVKETLYLELDYATFGFKKLKKLKKK